MNHRIGAQTITWGETIKENMRTIVRFLSAHSFAGVETGMRHFDATRPELYRALYEELGVAPLGLHSGGQFWLPDAAEAERRKLWDTLAFAQAVGFHWMVVSGNKTETADSMLKATETYTQIGRRCREAGLRFAYHNHNWELANDAEILDVLVQNTDSADVSLVLDIAWAHVGGTSIDDLLDRYGDRIAYLHIKDVSGEEFCELGTGDVDLDHVLQLADANGIEWLVVEQDYTKRTPEESMTINRDYLSARGW